MSIYGLGAVRLDATKQHVTHVLWRRLESQDPMHYHLIEANVLEVVTALAHGNHVHLLKEDKSGVHSIGPEFHIVIYPGGAEGIAIKGYALTELPTF